MHRLRFAPSPTGYLHVGGARTALFNWLFVKRYGGQFLLRIEDTDKARSTEESTRAIFDGLRWLGLDWDEEVTYQGANVERHRADVAKLVSGGHAYRCFCSPAELDEQRRAAAARGDGFRYDGRCGRLSREESDARVGRGESFAVRFRVPEGTTGWEDLVHGTITFPNRDIGEGDFIVLRSDATPIYNLAVVSDDIASGITLVMRGDDHISNTPKQILLYRALGATLPQFAHVPNVDGPDGRKLSKRHGATAVGDYQHMGILPQAMVNFLALLGWAPGNDVEVMTLPELTERFSTDGLQKKSAVFDMKKLEWMNGQHLARMSAAELVPLVTPLLAAQGLATEHNAGSRPEWFVQLLDLLKVRARTVTDLVQQMAPYLADPITYDDAAVAAHWKSAQTAELLGAVRETLRELSAWDPAAMEEALRSLATTHGVGAGKLFQPLRVALTGTAASPGIFDVLALLGRERSLQRLDAAIARVAGPAAAQ
jgi:glutamyl-tRNA synthetase